MTISSEILLDSIGPAGTRATTWRLRYPRFIHSSLMTHRVFSRNASSSRAISTTRMIDMVLADPVMPSHGKNKQGMSPVEDLTDEVIRSVDERWSHLCSITLETARKFEEYKLHKQIANRILEPWSHITVIVTATTFDNWFKLRMHETAQQEIQELAMSMHTKYSDSVPTEIRAGDWHLPLIRESERGEDAALLRFVSAGRCARVSYLSDNKSLEDDASLAVKLTTNGHWSPFEHQLCAMTKGEWNGEVAKLFSEALDKDEPFDPSALGNAVGWRQFRKLFYGESGKSNGRKEEG